MTKEEELKAEIELDICMLIKDILLTVATEEQVYQISGTITGCRQRAISEIKKDLIKLLEHKIDLRKKDLGLDEDNENE